MTCEKLKAAVGRRIRLITLPPSSLQKRPLMALAAFISQSEFKGSFVPSASGGDGQIRVPGDH